MVVKKEYNDINKAFLHNNFFSFDFLILKKKLGEEFYMFILCTQPSSLKCDWKYILGYFNFHLSIVLYSRF